MEENKSLEVPPEEMKDIKDNFEKTKDQMRGIGAAIETALSALHNKKMGYMLNVFEFGNPSIGNYVSNAKREDVILSLKELAERLEKKMGVYEGGENGKETRRNGDRSNNESPS